MAFRNVVNDGTKNPPRLRTQYNMWAMLKLPRDGAEWTVEQRLDKVAAAGFGGFESADEKTYVPEERARMIRDRGLEVGFASHVTEPHEMELRIDMAKRMRADYITAQVFGSLKSTSEIVDTLGRMYEMVNGAGLPFFIETHRGRVTQDLLRTLEVMEQMPQLRFTGDFSHYVVAGEMVGSWKLEVWGAFALIAQRCGNFHGRIGFGEQVQNDIGDGRGEMAQQFKKLWSIGMKHWLSSARPGDVLPFCAELGPPGYSIVDLNGREISDRWEQSLVVKRLIEEAFADAKKELGR